MSGSSNRVGATKEYDQNYDRVFTVQRESLMEVTVPAKLEINDIIVHANGNEEIDPMGLYETQAESVCVNKISQANAANVLAEIRLANVSHLGYDYNDDMHSLCVLVLIKDVAEASRLLLQYGVLDA